MTNQSYQKLCTEFYDLSKPEAGEKEISFYERFIKAAKGPVLEAMCGSGRLLLPLLRRGYKIDGVDDSAPMLQSCAQRCKSQNLKTNLFQQSLQNLSLPRKYSLIFIAVGSFQLIEDRSIAFDVLRKLYDHLLPKGTLLLETFVPWDVIKDCIDGATLLEKSATTFEKKISSNGMEMIHKGQATNYPQEQLETSQSQYEKIVDQKVIATEKERLAVRWYYRYEMELFLEKSGFSKIHLFDESFELNPQAIVYQAVKR